MSQVVSPVRVSIISGGAVEGRGGESPKAPGRALRQSCVNLLRKRFGTDVACRRRRVFAKCQWLSDCVRCLLIVSVFVGCWSCHSFCQVKTFYFLFFLIKLKIIKMTKIETKSCIKKKKIENHNKRKTWNENSGKNKI